MVLQPLKPTFSSIRHWHPCLLTPCLRRVAPNKIQTHAGTAVAAAVTAAAAAAVAGRRSRCRRLSRIVARAEPESRPRLKNTLCGFRPRVRYDFQAPQPIGPEIVLVGRSNAGKSTLLNEVQKRYGLTPSAAVSSIGGRTRNLAWYPVNFKGLVGWTKVGSLASLDELDRRALDPSGSEEPGNGFCLVDSFGMGVVDYSLRASRLQSWGPLLHGFLSERHTAVAVLHLVSSEYEGDLSQGDEQLLGIYTLAARARKARNMKPFSFGVVLTKTDLHSPEALPAIQERLQRNFTEMGHPPDHLVTCSTLANDGHGIDDFVTHVESLSARGWASRQYWLEEANLKYPRKAPTNRAAADRRAVRKSFREGRSYRKGGQGARTADLPPSV